MRITKVKNADNKYNVVWQISRGKALTLAKALRASGTPLAMELLDELRRGWQGQLTEDERQDVQVLD